MMTLRAATDLLLSFLGKRLVVLLVVAECSSSPAPPSIQPAAPAAVSKQMSERVPTALAELPKPPAAMEASAPTLSRETSFSAPPSSTLPSSPPSYPFSLPGISSFTTKHPSSHPSTPYPTQKMHHQKSWNIKKLNQNVTHPQSIFRLQQNIKV